MTQPQQRESFWRTLPGLLTAIAALITAVGTLVGALLATGAFDRDANSGGNGSPPSVAATKAFAGSWQNSNAGTGDLAALTVQTTGDRQATVRASRFGPGGVQDLGTATAEVAADGSLVTAQLALDSVRRWSFRLSLLSDGRLRAVVEECSLGMLGTTCSSNRFFDLVKRP